MKTGDLLARVQADWRAARPDIDATPMLTVIAVQRTSALLERELQAFFASVDLTPPNFDVLATLRRSAPPQGLLLSRLGTLMAITPPAVTKRIDALEARGLVKRHPHEADRRALLVQLTDEGRALVDALLPRHVENERRLLSGLDDAERAQLRALLVKLAASFEPSEA
ncbi:MarR family winged helix-turn-helix transcriptional regulator [Deinococcus yavapaiensis]|uniref:MarR family transcriptional regulator n=1 Tax=Deinococcus yavapaiensis KR-236 TaxID=694435 RepID=A0A318S852_9DEIO|nr:MarR family transcriptional regulator [Deinococcus yavapaiensis]PYE55236.1 MarR family transcriptional regulator [Deinococcus yavapaiensis KR-236]